MAAGGRGSWIPRIGQEFAGYRLDALIGSGGMSIVYRAEHLTLGRTVALKLLDPQLSEDAAFRERFLRESRHAASLDHPNIVPIFEAGEEEGVFYIAMRFVDGSDLKRLLRDEGTLSLDRTVSIISQVAAALGTAHAKGLVHRDIKPANILIASGIGVDDSDHVYLSDFGVAKFQASPALTKTGVFVGTTDYVAPEQIESGDVDGRADIYALGCVLYQCLTGAPAYQKDSEAALMYAHLLEPPPRPTEKRPDLPPEIDDVVATAMAKSPDDRFPTTRDLTLALREAASTDVGRSRGVASSDETQLAPPTQNEEIGRTTSDLPGREEQSVVAPASPAAEAAQPVAPAPLKPPRDGKRRSLLIALGGVVLLAAIAVVLGFVFTGDSSPEASSPSNGLPSNTVAITHGVLPLIPSTIQDGCQTTTPTAGSVSTVLCLPPANKTLPFYPERWQVSSYSSAAAADNAYQAERQSHNVSPDGGRCDGTTWGGEGDWTHGPGKPGGRRFCYFDGNFAVMVWTHAKLGQPTHVDLLLEARAGGTNHEGLFNWWRFWHHRIGKCPTEGCVAKLS